MRTFLGFILLIVGIAAIVAGVLYFTESAHQIPSFFPGHVSHVTADKLKKHAYAGFVAGAVLVIGGVVMLASGRRSSY